MGMKPARRFLFFPYPIPLFLKKSSFIEIFFLFYLNLPF